MNCFLPIKKNLFLFIFIYLFAFAEQIAPSSELYFYRLSWQDEFTNMNSRWLKADWTFKESQSEFSDNYVVIKDGNMFIEVDKKEATKGNFMSKKYWGGELYTLNDYMYGKYVVNMKPNCSPGVVASFFLFYVDFDSSLQPNDWAEIDIEFPGTTEYVQFNVRWMRKGDNKIHEAPKLFKLKFDASMDFHKYAIEWTPDYIAFYIDNHHIYTYKDADIIIELKHKMSIRMNSWISNSISWAGQLDDRNLPNKSCWGYVKYFKMLQYN